MTRRKQAAPLQRVASSELMERPLENPPGHKHMNGHSKALDSKAKAPIAPDAPEQAGLTQLIICIGGIYASFLSWAVLQERITTTPYGPPSSPERFTYSIFLNTVQSAFAALTGYIYLLSTSSNSTTTPSIFPSRAILGPLILISITSSLASPFGYASLAHIDYITFILAKSCKLLPVMFLQLTVFRKRYPLYKYLVVLLVTAGVAIFTLHHPSTSSKSTTSSKPPTTSNAWGLLLLSINLLLDGLTNSTQDHIFTNPSFRPYTGPQMMAAQNILCTLLTTTYLLLSPSPIIQSLTHTFGIDLPNAGTELHSALAFIRAHPAVGYDVLAFSACGAVGQLFIFYTLSRFSSLLLVTVTVTRKMLTMMLSVVWFGHRLSGMQWVGVGLVFGGVGAEGWIQRREKGAKEKARRKNA
ncbi:MAG: UDP-galactose transporter [Pleopsidium flavum]|nr:MAG: UDP-galactose transporter [Pleopsidium flavum]